MYGAILGDIIGSPYEFDRGNKSKDFPLFVRQSSFTDDSVMSIAVAEALLDAGPDASPDEIRLKTVKSMQKWGRRYPNAGYGARFIGWVHSEDPRPYNSFGNGAAMRVSAVGWLYDTLERTLEVADAVTDVTHDHPEGIKGARATAAAIFMARNGASKEEIKEYIQETIGYDLSRSCDEIRPRYHHVESCQETVPEAITAFLEGENFEDVIRTAVSLGGDCDTLTCIAGSIAEAMYGLPDGLEEECRKRLTEDLLEVLDRLTTVRQEKILGKHGFSLDQLQETINATYPGLTMFVRDANLPAEFVKKYVPGEIIMERGFTDASCRVMGMKTTHRYAIMSNHMTDLSSFEHGTNWGLFVAQHGAHFKVMDIYEYDGKTMILLLHLPDDDRWKIFIDTHINIDDQLIEDCRNRFRNKCNEEVIPELATEEWLARCAAPLGMDDEGNLFPIE